MYIITEYQTAQDGTVATIVTQKESRNEADSVYHTILASAAISALPVHAASIVTNEGQYIDSAFYRHGDQQIDD